MHVLSTPDHPLPWVRSTPLTGDLSVEVAALSGELLLGDCRWSDWVRW